MSEIAFDTTVWAGTPKNVTGIEVPEQIIAALGKGHRPRVKVSLNGYCYSITIGKMGDRFMISLSAEHREASGLSGGDPVHVTLQLDSDPQTIIIPNDLQAALANAPGALAAFERLAPSRRKAEILNVEGAKAPETRLRRVAAITARMASS